MKDDFADQLAAATPAPGGGAAAARVGLYASSLVQMVTNLTLKKEKEASLIKQLTEASELGRSLSEQFRDLERDDIAAFNGFMEALRLPRETAEEKTQRDAARRGAAQKATEVPLTLMAACQGVLRLGADVENLSQRTRLSAESDLRAAAEFARAAARAAELNVEANLPYLDAGEAARVQKESAAVSGEIEALYGRLTGG